MNMDIVIVDDDAVVLFLHKVLIQKTFSGSISEYHNASAALEFVLKKAENSQPILILLDINMPGMNGWEFLEELQQKTSEENIFIVMVTSSINSSDRKKADQYPRVIDYLEKPLSRQSCKSLQEKIARLF